MQLVGVCLVFNVMSFAQAPAALQEAAQDECVDSLLSMIVSQLMTLPSCALSCSIQIVPSGYITAPVFRSTLN